MSDEGFECSAAAHDDSEWDCVCGESVSSERRCCRCEGRPELTYRANLLGGALPGMAPGSGLGCQFHCKLDLTALNLAKLPSYA